MNRKQRRAALRRLTKPQLAALVEAERLAHQATVEAGKHPDDHALRARAFALVQTRDMLRAVAGIEPERRP